MHGLASDQTALTLVRVDQLATEILARMVPLRFALARSAEERIAVLRLRYQVVTERGWSRPEDLPDGLERDIYDDHAEYVVAWDNATLIAATRLVYPGSGLRLPTEEAFDLRIEPHGQVVDAGRFIVTRPYSDCEHRVLAALLARTWLEVRQRGYSAICAAFAARSMIRLYSRMGFRVVQLGPPQHYWGEVRYPVRFDVLAAAPALLKRWGTPATEL